MAVSGKLLVGGIVATALLGGSVLYWLQVHAFYNRLGSADVTLTVTENGTPRPVAVTSLSAIDANSSPIRFRACFQTPEPVRGDAYASAVPLNAPGWFDCFDAAQVGADLDSGAAVAVMGQANIEYGIDRVLAIYPDGRGVAWHQINACGKEVFDGNPPPPGCPPPPAP